MSDFEMISIFLMMFGIFASLIISNINKKK